MQIANDGDVEGDVFDERRLRFEKRNHGVNDESELIGSENELEGGDFCLENELLYVKNEEADFNTHIDTN